MARQRLMQRFARWHIWLGWVVALPILMWVVTGLVMVARPIGEVRGDSLLARPAAIDPADIAFPRLERPIQSAELVEQAGRPVWIVTEASGGRYRYSAADGSLAPPVIESEARRLALAAYAGSAGLETVTYFPADAAPLDMRRKIDSWQARFADGTHLYIDATTGEVLALRTGWWRFYDFMYGLHIMDLQSHENAHNPFVAAFAIPALVAAALGAVLLFRRRKARAKA